jgi:hypothetical protein
MRTIKQNQRVQDNMNEIAAAAAAGRVETPLIEAALQIQVK